VLAEELTKRIVARWGEALDLWQLPIIPLGLAREHQWAPGTLSLSIGSLSSLLRDFGREIVRALPARNLAIINGHGGNSGILQALMQDSRAEFGLNVCVLHPAGMLEAETGTAIPDIHGGKDETSLMLAVAPHLVRQDRIAQLKSPPGADEIRKKVLPRGIIWPWTTDDPRLADMGVIGDAKAASPQRGQKLLAQIVDMAGDVLKELLEEQKTLRRRK
jgi:creatinine amidohydrolase